MAAHVVAVVQARMGSTRLPGKVLADIAGSPMLDRVLRRLSLVPEVNTIVVATSTLPQDDVLDEHVRRLGFGVVRGDPIDVLARYADAVRATAADIVVRVTSDCPFVDPGVVSQVIRTLLTGADAPVDYASNAIEPRTFPRGLDVEAMSAAVLLEADRLDRDPGSREHVTPFIRESGRYRVAAVVNAENLSDARWTVDTAEDLAVARLLALHAEQSGSVGWRELLEVWRAHPSWRAINVHVEQKQIERKA